MLDFGSLAVKSRGVLIIRLLVLREEKKGKSILFSNRGKIGAFRTQKKPPQMQQNTS